MSSPTSRARCSTSKRTRWTPRSATSASSEMSPAPPSISGSPTRVSPQASGTCRSSAIAWPPTPGVEHVASGRLDDLEVERVVVDQEHHGVGSRDLFAVELDEADAGIDLFGEHVRVDRSDHRSQSEQTIGDGDGRRLSRVAGV